MKKLVLFDLDGTLLDTPKAIVETFTATFHALKLNPCSEQSIRATIGMPLEKAFRLLTKIENNDEIIQQAVKEYQVQFKKLILPKAKDLLFPDVEDGLKILLKEGFLLSIATNKFYQSAHDILTAAGLRSYFSLVLGADQVTRPKPDPEAGNLSLQKMNVSPENSIMVGDTTLDIYMAKSAGMRSIAVTYGIHSLQELKSSEPTWIADNFMEVISVIKDNVIVKEELKKC